MESLQAIAQASGKSLQDVLQIELQKLSVLKFPAIEPPRPGTPAEVIPEPKNPAKESTSVKPPYQLRSPATSVADTMSLNLPTSALNPPGIQRVVMEHVVKTSDAVSSSHAFRLKAFSGRSLRPSTEPDFDTWRVSVDFLLNDASLSDIKLEEFLTACCPQTQMSLGMLVQMLYQHSALNFWNLCMAQ